jgi:hypothetical protein
MNAVFLLFALLLIGIVLVSGCTSVGQVTNIFCEPDWVRPSAGSQFVSALSGEDCKTLCYKEFGTTSYKIEGRSCVCDVNNCKKNE